MIQKETTIINKLGLHARAAAKLTSITSKYCSKISITYNNKTIDGKSIMATMMLAAGKGAQLKITFDGIDEVDASIATCELINNYFNEEQ